MIHIVNQPIDEAALLETVRDPKCGAIVLFVGTTRQFTEDRETRELAYECFVELARKELERLRDAASERWPIGNCAIVHRVGIVPLAESSIAVAVSSPHRRDAFRAAEWLMDQIKQSVPIWKQEHWADGTQQWIHPGVETDTQPEGIPLSDSTSDGAPGQCTTLPAGETPTRRRTR